MTESYSLLFSELLLLHCIVDECNKNPLGLVTPAELAATIGLDKNQSKNQRVMMWRLYSNGWLERPIRGGYRPSKKALEYLKED